MTREIKITVGEDSFVLKSALIGGTLNNFVESPTAMYCGPLNLDEIHSTLFYAHRSIIKILVDEFNIPLKKVDEFLLSAMSEALTQEYNESVSGESDMEFARRIKFRED